MKSSYELAMERLNKNAPTVKLTDAQKKQLAELDSKYAAKIAEREIALEAEISKAADDFEKEESLREQLATERKKLRVEIEEKKEQLPNKAFQNMNCLLQQKKFGAYMNATTRSPLKNLRQSPFVVVTRNRKSGKAVIGRVFEQTDSILWIACKELSAGKN